MKQEVRVILAFVLSMAIFAAYQMFFAPPPPRPLTTETTATTTTTPVNPETPGMPIAAPIASEAQVDTNVDETFVATPQQIKVVTDKTSVVLDTVGGMLTSYKMKDYRREAKKDSPTKDLLTETEGSNALFIGLKGYDSLTPKSVFQIVSDRTNAEGFREITLAWQDKNIRLEKTFTFGSKESSYVIKQNYVVTNRSPEARTVTPFVQSVLHQKPEPEHNGILSKLSRSQPDEFHGLHLREQKLVTQSAWKNFTEAQESGPISWAAISDRYFLISTARLETPPQASVFFQKQGDFLVGRILTSDVNLAPGTKTEGSFYNYIGPKELKVLRKLPASLKKAVDYGWFDFMAVPILWLLNTIHKVIPSWGLVIIALTFLVKLALHPVNKKSMQSMKGMQQLQPKMKEIRKKYANDQQKQNEEVMHLFRTHKVNPMGGCLPMFLQMPIYIVLYKVLWNAIELYHAPFLWYSDLSAPDPYFVAPILLGVFMFFQQKLTPSASADPTQQKMMMIMPLMFTTFMLFLPVGLVLYIFVNTFVSVVQQFMMQRDLSFKDLLTGKWQARGA